MFFLFLLFIYFFLEDAEEHLYKLPSPSLRPSFIPEAKHGPQLEALDA